MFIYLPTCTSIMHLCSYLQYLYLFFFIALDLTYITISLPSDLHKFWILITIHKYETFTYFLFCGKSILDLFYFSSKILIGQVLETPCGVRFCCIDLPNLFILHLKIKFFSLNIMFEIFIIFLMCFDTVNSTTESPL